MTTGGGARERQRFRDAVLLASGTEGGATGRGVQAGAASQKRGLP